MLLKYRPDLDGLRTIAVYLVLLFHAGLGWAGGGFIGVDLFFVLSGFLVTSVILGEIESTGRLRVSNFYSRRVRRLLPAALVVVTATSVAFTILWSVARRLAIVGDAQSALLYYANWHFLGQAGDYFASDIDKSPFLHFWSLSIEEQFYFVFPVLLLLLSRTGRRVMFGVLAALFALSLASQVYWGRIDTNHAYYGTDARLYQLLAGAMLSVALRTWRPRLRGRAAGTLAITGLVGLLVLGSGQIGVSPSYLGIGAMVVSVLLIGGLTLAEDGLLARLLGRPVPVFLGRISYGTYLWHWPVIVALTTLFSTSPLVIATFAFGISTGLAALSYEVLEMPIRKAKVLNGLRWQTAVVGVGASALVAATLVPAVLHLDRKPALASASAAPAVEKLSGAAGAKPVPGDIDWEKVNGDVGGQGWCTADDPSACTVVKGHGPHILFIGDSQAQMLVPMFEKLAKEHDLTLSLDVLAGCPWQEGLSNGKQSPDGAKNCASARVGWYDKVLPKLHPDVVVLLDRPRDDPKEWSSLVARRDGRKQPLDEAVYETTRDTLKKISAVVPRTLVVQRLVMPETFDPTDCLSSMNRIGQCAVPVPDEPSPSDGYFAALAAQTSSITPVNLNDAFCPTAPVCLPVVGNEVVWRDDHHYTASYAVSRREAVWRLLTATGALGAGSD